MFSLPAQVLADGLAPSLARWSEAREASIMTNGQVLPAALIRFAKELNIDDPEAIRVELRQKIPMPIPEPLVSMAQKLRLPIFHPSGMCLGRCLSCQSLDEALLRHELIHTLQYQRLGSHRAFMWHYIFQCLHHGYYQAPLEIEARERSKSIGHA